jgi:hypothetical protein
VALLDTILRVLVGRHSIADEPVDFSRIGTFRAEHFPKSGPRPWLDRENARIDEVPEARFYRQWAESGYVILPGLIPSQQLDAAWRAYEEAIQRGSIELADDAAGEGDSLPGR